MKTKISPFLHATVVAGILLLSTSLFAQNPYKRSDNSWISLNGTVVSIGENSFVLDYGEGLITVDMDDWNWYRKGNRTLEGRKVTVTGRVDADFLEKRTIEAGSVYVEDLNTYYYASAADEDIDPYIVSSAYVEPLEDDSRLTLVGRVTRIDGREFALDIGDMSIQVSTIGMGYNPLDNIGFQQINEGNRVSVYGELDLNFFEQQELNADSILTLSRDVGKSEAESEEPG